MKYKVTYIKYERPLFVFNCGSAQDARALFIGNMYFSKDKGTWFSKSQFVKAIETPNAIIVLDELSRMSHDGVNILIPVLDSTQKYIRLDETEDSSIIKVAEGVTFIATANVGNEYTATRVMDKALLSRFPVIIEMPTLSAKEELELLGILYPDVTDEQHSNFKSLTKISEETKLSCKMDNARINTFITTDSVIEMGGLLLDGFSIDEIVEMTIYPQYNEDGGQDCERLFVKQLVQKYIDTTSAKTKSPINDPTKSKLV